MKPTPLLMTSEVSRQPFIMKVAGKGSQGEVNEFISRELVDEEKRPYELSFRRSRSEQEESAVC
jgi:hypothetical protein